MRVGGSYDPPATDKASTARPKAVKEHTGKCVEEHKKLPIGTPGTEVKWLSDSYLCSQYVTNLKCQAEAWQTHTGHWQNEITGSIYHYGQSIWGTHDPGFSVMEHTMLDQVHLDVYEWTWEKSAHLHLLVKAAAAVLQSLQVYSGPRYVPRKMPRNSDNVSSSWISHS